MRKLGYFNKFIYFIKIICKNTQVNVFSKGFFSTSFSLSTGMSSIPTFSYYK